MPGETEAQTPKETIAVQAIRERMERANEKRRFVLRRFQLEDQQAREFAGFAYLVLGDKVAESDPEVVFSAVLTGLLDGSLTVPQKKKIQGIPKENLLKVQEALFALR